MENFEPSCIFCKIIKKEIKADIVYETPDILCFLDSKPLNPGHILVVPKSHYTDMFDTPDDVVQKLILVSKKIGKVVKDVTGADGINIGQNNGRAAGQIIFHNHIHVIPRFAKDGYKSWERHDTEPKQENMGRLAKEIGNKVNNRT